MRFVLDDGPWAGANTSLELFRDSLDAFADLLDVARVRLEAVGAHDGIFDAEIAPGVKLFEALYDPSNPLDLDRELRQRLSVRIDRIEKWGDDAVVAIDVDIAGKQMTAPGIDKARERCATGARTACLTPATSGRRGTLSVVDVATTKPTAAQVCFVVDEWDHVRFFREVIVLEKADVEEFAALAPSAWPGLAFVDRLWKGFGDFSRSYREIRDDVMEHLSVLSDDGAAIFERKLHKEIEAQFMSRGVTISPENAETLADRRCREARERAFAGETLLFDWHTKIELHQDRIHVHPPTRTSDGRTVVGIFHKHLPLPGD